MARILFQAGAEKPLIFESSFALTLRNKTCGFPGSSFISLSCLNVISLPASLSHATIVACIKRSPIAFPLPSRTALEFTSHGVKFQKTYVAPNQGKENMTSPEPNCLWAQALYSLKLKTAVAADFGTSWIAHLSMAPHRFHLAWTICPPRHHTLGLLRPRTA